MEFSSRSLRLSDPKAGNDKGWTLSADSPILAENLGFGARLLYVQWRDHEDQLLYRQPLIAERGGSAALAVNRSTGSFRLAKLPRPYVRDLGEYRRTFPDIEPSNLGRNMWEAPRGLSRIAESYDATAIRETEEELQATVVSCEFLTNHVSNSTYIPQPTKLFLVTVDLLQTPATLPDTLEGVQGSLWFTLEDYRKLQDGDDAVDGTTAHCILAVMLRYPGLLK